MLPKISYLLPTAKPSFCTQAVLDNLSLLPQHEHEVIIVSTTELDLRLKHNVKFILDTEKKGSVAPINVAYKASDGDIIVIVVDDHFIPPNFLDIERYFNEPKFKSKKIKVGNLSEALGGPGFNTYSKSRRKLVSFWSLDHQFRKEKHPNFHAYNLVSFPVIFRESIEKYMDGVVFNESFIHHLPDHWLGYYSDMINGDVGMGPTHVWFTENPRFNQMTQQKNTDEYDAQVLFKLIKMSSEGIPYNFPIDIDPSFVCNKSSSLGT
jgi:hypothetical protein